jgi:hypothetical protein
MYFGLPQSGYRKSETNRILTHNPYPGYPPSQPIHPPELPTKGDTSYYIITVGNIAKNRPGKWKANAVPAYKRKGKGDALKQKTRHTMGGFFHAVGFG